jgi:hypothetical protein
MMLKKPHTTPQLQAIQTESPSSEDQLKERAYYQYLKRGRADGKDVDDWLEAETQLRNETSVPVKS